MDIIFADKMPKIIFKYNFQKIYFNKIKFQPNYKIVYLILINFKQIFFKEHPSMYMRLYVCTYT